MRSGFLAIAVLFLLALLAPGAPALAACTSPAGNAGAVLYNDAVSVLQYCDGTNWIKAGLGPKTGGGCTLPTGTKGSVVYNADFRVMQYCNGFEWVAMGNGGAGSGVVGVGGAWEDVTAGSNHSCGIKSDSTLWCWGINDNGQIGDNSSGTNRLIPTAINGGGTWKQVAAGDYHTCGIKSDDTLWCWGDNANGQIGDNTSGTNRLIPTAVNGGGTWKQVAAGYGHTCGIKSDSTLWCWGMNWSGQIGDNTSGTNRLIPTAVNGGGTWKQVAAGANHTCGIKTDDTLWCWGDNWSGQIGDNTSGTNRLIPTAVNGGGTWKQVAAGDYHSCGIKSDDTLRCWGSNSNGQIGDNTTTQRNIPTAVNGGGTWKQVATGDYYSCGIKSDDTIWCWGENWAGQIGDNTLGTNRLIPTAVNGGGTWKQVAADYAHTCGIKSDSTLWCWGYNGTGQIGDNSSGTGRLIPTVINGGGTWKQVAAGDYHSCGIKFDDTLRCWGYNGQGQIGDNTSGTDLLIPTAVNGGGTWKQVATGDYHTCGIKSDDTLSCWGDNSTGQIGDNTSGTNRLIPTAVNGGGTWKQVAAGYGHTCGIKLDSTLWCWGDNAYGQIGDNTTTQRNIPTAVNGGGTWKQVAAGANHTCGIKSDDTIWCWGDNATGQIGDNSATQRLVPTAVNGGGTWKQVAAAGYGHTCGIKFDDTLWCWGYNAYGQIGDNTSGTDRLIPTAVNGGGTWKQVAAGTNHTCGIKSDDTLRCWGSNSIGQIGDNTSGTDRLIPTAVNGGGTWKQVAAGYGHTCGIKFDDSLWCWGDNGNGQITATEFSAPYRTSPATTICSAPPGKVGALLYNADLAILQYCNGVSWVGVGK